MHLTQHGVAFSAYVSAHETELSKGYTIHFDRIITNIGSHYNKYSGVFIAPQHGIYVFAWTLYCHAEGYIFSELVVNSNVVGAMVSDGELQGATNIRTATGIVVVAISQGDDVYVRTHPTKDHRHNLYSDPAWRSSFNGWKVWFIDRIKFYFIRVFVLCIDKPIRVMVYLPVVRLFCYELMWWNHRLNWDF